MKIGIFGGTFDPVHIGHIKMAEYAKEEFGLEKVVFVPNSNPPHKKDKLIEDYFHRFNMLKLALANDDRFLISDYEAKDGKYYYSLHTMRHFRNLYGEDTFFIIGADSLMTIHEWYEYETLLKENKFIVFLRDDLCGFYERVEKYKALGAKIYVSKMPEVEISSTVVRKDINQYNQAYGILDEVYDYIVKNGLYGGSYDSKRD